MSTMNMMKMIRLERPITFNRTGQKFMEGTILRWNEDHGCYQFKDRHKDVVLMSVYPDTVEKFPETFKIIDDDRNE